MRTLPGNDAIRIGRLRKAKQFYDAATVILEFADDEDDVGDAFITLCVHAGIAAADAICIRNLGVHAHGRNHNEAIALLKEAAASNTSGLLSTLLDLKTKAGYSHQPSTSQDRKKAGRAAEQLIDAAR